MSKRKPRDDDEEVFPRGRPSGSAEAPRLPADADAERGEASDEKPQKKHRRAKDAEDEEEPIRELKRVPRLKFADLSEGSVVLAAVQTANEEELTLNLPFSLIGYVPRRLALEADADESLKLPDIFPPGMLVVAVVMAVLEVGKQESGKHRLELSLRPTLANAGLSAESVATGMWLPATVEDEEEHALRLSFGVEGLRGILKRTELAGSARKQPKGSLLMVAIEAVASSGVLKCTASGSEPLPDSAPINLSLLKAGTLVRGRIDTVVANQDKDGQEGSNLGLVVGFCGSLTGWIHWHHQGDALEREPVKRKQRVTARVLAVIPGSTVRVHLTLLPHLVEWSSQADALAAAADVGDRMSGEVLDFQPKFACRMRCTASDKEGATPVLGICPANKLAAEGTEPTEKSLQVGAKAKCRVLSFNYLDAAFFVTRRPADLKDGVLVSVNELNPGQLVSGEIVRISDFGVFVKLSDYVTGLVHLRHLTDVPLATVPKRFQLGAKLKCRVLRVFAARRQISLTAKKALLNDDFQFHDVVAQAKRNLLVTGFVVKVMPYGAIVNFFGEAKGLIPGKEMEADEAPAVGMAVRCRINYLEREKKRVVLSLKLEGGIAASELPDSAAPAAVYGGPQRGTLVSAASALLCTEAGVVVRFEAEEGSSDPAGLGFVQLNHLSDDLALAKDWHASLAAKLGGVVPIPGDLKALEAEGSGTPLDARAVVLGKSFSAGATSQGAERPFVLLSLKASLCLAVDDGAFVTDITELKEGALYAGYVKQVMEFGALVCVGSYRLAGMVHRSQVATRFVEKPTEELQVGQTVRVLVSEINVEKKRFAGDLRPGLVKDSDMPLLRREAEALRLYLEARTALRADVKDKVAAKRRALLLPGTVVAAKVTSLKPYGLVLSLPEHGDLTAVALKANIPAEAAHEEGSELRCAILDFDADTGIADVSLHPELVEAPQGKAAASTAGGKKKKKQTEDGEQAEGLAVGTQLMVLSALQKPAYSILWSRSPPAVVLAPPFGIRKWAEPRAAVVHSMPENGEKSGRIIVRAPTEGRDHNKKSRVPKIYNPKEELLPGTPVVMKVHSIHGLQVFCTAPVGIRGHVHASQLVDLAALGSPPESPLDYQRPRGTLEARVLKLRHQSEDGKKAWHVELTCRPALMQADDTSLFPSAMVRWQKLKVGMPLVAVVLSVRSNLLWCEVAPGIKGKVSLLDASADMEVLKNLSTHFKAGQALQTVVMRAISSKKKLDLALHEASLPAAVLEEQGKAPPKSKKVLAKLLRLEMVQGKGLAASFRLPGRRTGVVHVTEIFDAWVNNPAKRLKLGTIHEAWLLKEASDEAHAELSLRPSLVHGRKAAADEDRILTLAGLKVGQVVNGYVVNSNPKGVFVAISRHVVGRIRLKSLSDKPVMRDAVSRLYPPGTLIRDVIVAEIDEASGHLELSLRKSADVSGKLTLEQLSVGDVVSGIVKAVEKYGLFVRLDNSAGVDGLVHKSEVSDNASVSLDSYQPGTKIARAKVIKIEGRKLNLSIKPSNFDDEMEDEDEDEDEEDEDAAPAKPKAVKVKAKPEVSTEVEAPEAPEPTEASRPKRKAQEVAAGEDSDEEPWRLPAAGGAGTAAAAAFEWADFKVDAASSSDEDVEPGSEDDGEDGPAKKKPSKRQKKALKAAEEELLRKREAENADGLAAPRSVEDFERLLLTEGDTSIIWIRYMAFHLKMSDLNKARQVAERAVKHVGFSESKERFNAWVAFMNLECTFGTEESADAVFKRAASHNDAKEVHLQLARIHERNKKQDLAVKVYQQCCRKFGHSQQVWIAYLTFLYHGKDLELARSTLPKCLATLPRKKHPMVVSKAALLEYQLGSPERGRSIFEGLLDSYPKRTDLWSVYIDAHIKAYTPPKVATPELREVRSLLERCCTMKLKAVKMRFFFKRFLDFEKRWGDEESQEKVRGKARDFVESQAV